MNVRENWRIALLVVFVAASAVMLFVPGAVPGATGGGEDPTNLQYGIQLDGGTRLQAPAVGITAEDVNVSADDEAALASNVSSALSVDRIDVRVSAESSTVEVFARDVTHDELRSVLEAEGYRPSTVRDGVTQRTREEMVRVVSDKLRQSALDSGSVSTIRSTGGQQFISITAPDRDREELRSLLDERGVVRVYALVPTENGTYVRHQVLSQGDFARISPAETQRGQAVVPVTIRESVAQRYQEDMVRYGFEQQTVCNYDRDEPQNTRGRCLLATLNGEVVFAGGVDQGLADLYRTGEFAENPVFQMETRNISEARELEISLRAGRLPAPLNFEEARSTELEPALAQRFKTNSLIVGILAVFAVSGMVYLRYRNPRVALPMIVTALSEVVILLGFVSSVQYALNLSHIAGFIAVIGTGVDDLIIIADEILQQGEVATGRVFRSRFRKAFWVIGAAAATTIIAMSPLTVLGLGDLSGFAIVTIVGVLVGVLVTRPAYGDILRNLVLRQDRDDD
ncbi:MAG: preprotein translocase subunit SecD [Haloarculaceae archaeon]